MARRTRDEAAETRNRIIDAAERVFSERGVSHTSLDDIARAAGVTRGAIYWHFKNKSELFTAMVGRIRLPIEDMVARGSDDAAEDPLALVKEAAVTALKRTATDPQCQRVFDIVTHKCEYLQDMEVVKGRLSELKADCVMQTEKAIRNAMRRGQLPKTLDARLAAIGLDAMLFGLISNWLADRSYVDLERDAEALIERYLRCLAAEPVEKKPARKTRPALKRPRGSSPARRRSA